MFIMQAYLPECSANLGNRLRSKREIVECDTSHDNLREDLKFRSERDRKKLVIIKYNIYSCIDELEHKS